MALEESVSESALLQGWVAARSEALRESQLHLASTDLGGEPAQEHPSSSSSIAVLEPLMTSEGLCPHTKFLDVSTPEGARELFGFGRAEIDCTSEFLRAAVVYGRHLLVESRLTEYDIVHELIRAETGYRLARLSGHSVDPDLFTDFMDFQQDLARKLEGWSLWEYEFAHWRYHKRPPPAIVGSSGEGSGGGVYEHLYSAHRPPALQHLECPATPLVYRLWANFPTCPPSRLSDLPRFHDAYISAMTVDNWRAGYRDFLSEGYNYNVSFFEGGDPTPRLSKGAHSIFAGVFIQKMPTDLWCYQQVIHDLRPRYVIDLGASQGGSAVWFASMLKLFEIPGGKVISVDLALEQAYWLSKRRAEEAAKRLKVEDRIDWNYVPNGSKNPAVREKVAKLCAEAPCMVISDSDHDYSHTYYEMEWYAQHVGVGQYLVVEDTNIYGWSGWMNINDPNEDGLKKGPMEAANDFEFSHKADFARTDWCAKHYGLSQTQHGWFFRKSNQAHDFAGV